MILLDFAYLAPTSLKVACNFLKEHGPDAKIMAGGTDLINLMKDKIMSRNCPIVGYRKDVKIP
jgi:CO/xanthine dehydrogenase FAD-binding subunit